MHTKKLHIYEIPPKKGVSNEYPTSKNAFRQPMLQMIVGQRTAGKSHLCAMMLQQFKLEQTFHVVYLITPSYESNKSYWEGHILRENVFEPTKDSINQVIARVEQDRDEWERFLAEKKQHAMYQKAMQKGGMLGDDLLLHAFQRGWMDNLPPPKWKYAKEGSPPEPPKSILIMDDVLSSPAISQSSGLTRISTLNRHVSPLKESHSDRSACGLAVCILTQSYRMQGGIGRVLRENLSLLTIFKNKQQQQMQAIREELANVVDEDLFNRAYEYATREKYGNLTVDFRPKTPELTFRKNLSEAIIF